MRMFITSEHKYVWNNMKIFENVIHSFTVEDLFVSALLTHIISFSWWAGWNTLSLIWSHKPDHHLINRFYTWILTLIKMIKCFGWLVLWGGHQTTLPNVPHVHYMVYKLILKYLFKFDFILVTLTLLN